MDRHDESPRAQWHSPLTGSLDLYIIVHTMYGLYRRFHFSLVEVGALLPKEGKGELLYIPLLSTSEDHLEEIHETIKTTVQDA